MSTLLVVGPCCICLCISDRLCSRTALISVCFSYNSTMRLLTVSFKSRGVSIVLLSSDYSSLLWDISPNSWCVTILYDVDFMLSIDYLSADKTSYVS
jgi:hypothetical protein